MTVGKQIYLEANVMAEQEKDLAQQVQSGEPALKLTEDVDDAGMEATHKCVQLRDDGNISIVTRLCSVVHPYRQPLKVMKHFTFSDAAYCMRQGGPWRKVLIAAAGIASFAALTGALAFAFLLISSSLNAAFASFLMAISLGGFFMAFFFSSMTVMYVGALGFGGLTIGSIAFFSVWAVIILSGWVAIGWVIWQGIRKAFQFGKHLAFVAGSILFSFPVVQRLQPVGFQLRELYHPLKSRKVTTD